MFRISNLYRVSLLDGVSAESRSKMGKILQNTPVAPIKFMIDQKQLENVESFT